MEKASGITPPELDAPPLLVELEYLWGWFCELSSTRSSGMGLNPITYQDLAAWQSVTGNRLSRWEVEAIRALDNVFIVEMTKE